MNEKELKIYLEKKVADVKAKALAVLEVEAPKSIRKNFQQGGRPEKWKPVKKKPKKYRGTKTLVQRGNLMKVSAVKSVEDTSVTLMANPLTRAYARIQHEGGTINMPARKIKFRVKKYKDAGTVLRRSKRTVFASSKIKRVKFERAVRPYVIKIPARPFMVIPDEDLMRIVRIINR